MRLVLLSKKYCGLEVPEKIGKKNYSDQKTKEAKNMFSNRNVHETSQEASKSRQKISIITEKIFIHSNRKDFFVFNGYLFRKILFRPISVLSGMF